MADGKVIIDVILEDGSVAKGVANVEDSIGGLGGASEKASLSIGKIASALGLVYAAKKGIDLVKESISGAMDRIDTMEQFERVMGVMVDDTDAVAGAMNRLEDIVEGTSMKTDVMANGIQNFVTRGMEIDQATDTVEAWGNAVAFYGDGSNEQFENVSDALQNMVAKGKVGQDQLNRLFEAGIPATEIYADAVGESTADVEEALSKGEISAEDFVKVVSDAMMEGTDNFGEISTAMKDQGMSWGSVLENMSNYAQQGMQKIITAIDDMLVENGLPDMRKMIDNFGRAFGNVLSSIAEKIPDIVEKIKEIYNVLEPWLPLITAIGTGIATFIGIIGGISVVTSIIAKVKAAFDLLKFAIFAVQYALMTNPIVAIIAAIAAAATLIYIYWEPISEFFLGIWETIKDFGLMIWDSLKEAWGMAVEFLMGIWEGISEYFSELWDSIKEIFMLVWEPIQEAWQEVIEFFTEIWLDLVEFFTELWEDIKETMLEVWEPILETWQEIVEFFTELWTGVVEVFTEIWNTIVEVIVEAWNAIIEFITPTMEFISSIISGAWQAIQLIISMVMTAIQAYIQTYWTIIQTVISTVMSVIKTVITTAWEVIKTVITTVVNVIKTIIETTWNVIKGVIQLVMSAIQGDVSGIWNAIKSIISSVLSGISSIISSVWNAILSIISSVMSGISSTISSIWSSILSTVSSIVSSISSAVSSVFNSLGGIVSGAMGAVLSAISTGMQGALNTVTGIASSFLDAGKNIVKSIADGIMGAMSLVTDAISNVTDAVRDYLPFSPAKEGALRDIMDIQLAQSVAKAIDKGKGSAVDSMKGLTDELNDEMQTETSLLTSIKGFTPESAIGGLKSDNMQLQQSVTNYQKSSSNYDDKEVKEILKQIADKDSNLYVGEHELGEVTDKEQAKRTKLAGRRVSY